MCEIISVAVEPRKAEVFWAPGIEHHTELCKLTGLNYDRVFKPDIHLYNKQIDFHDGPIALKRNPPQDGNFIYQMLRKPDEYGEFLYTWDERHQASVMEWMGKHIADYRKLVSFADHSWNPYHFRGTVSGGMFHEAIDGLDRGAIESNVADRELLHEAWRRDFHKTDNRAAIWK